jgi:predicted RNA-binding Zn-ribbon protein involved in translation (DUF1610 family)
MGEGEDLSGMDNHTTHTIRGVDSMRCCLECGSTDITLRYGGKLGWVYICKECGWQGRTIVDFPDESLKKMKMMEKTEKMAKTMDKMEKRARKARKH